MLPGALTDARLQLHHAAQIAVSAAISYIPARSDDSHTALTWVGSNGALVTEQITAAAPFRIGVRVEDLTLHAIDSELRSTNSFALAGRTVGEANNWLAAVAAEAGLDLARLKSAKHYTIPGHPVASGAPFSAQIGSALAELSKYWSNAGMVLDDLVRATEGASPVRTWPHHFDMASLITLPGAGPRRTIGVGQSAGGRFVSRALLVRRAESVPIDHQPDAIGWRGSLAHQRLGGGGASGECLPGRGGSTWAGGCVHRLGGGGVSATAGYVEGAPREMQTGQTRLHRSAFFKISRGQSPWSWIFKRSDSLKILEKSYRSGRQGFLTAFGMTACTE
jgi:hypothetical protein